MAIKVTPSFRDVNGQASRTSFYTPNELTAIFVLQSLANLSNAGIENAYYNINIPLDFLANNNAVAGNVETVKTKLRVTFEGDDLDPTAADATPQVSLYIPAPVGTVYNGSLANLQSNATLQKFYGVHALMSPFGVAMARIVGGGYSRKG
jgi:hypothetical protein